MKRIVIFGVAGIVGFLALFLICNPATASGIVQQAYNLVQDEGTGLARRTTINFTGSGVTCSDSGGKTVCNVPGGATSAYSTIQDEGIPLTMESVLNFIGSLITCVDDSMNSRTNCTVGSAYSTVQNSGSSLTQRTTVNFTGAGVTCVDNAGQTRTDCSIPGGGGGSLSASGTFYATDGTNYYSPIFPSTPADGLSFAWRNQGTSTITTVGKALYLNVPTSSSNISGREVATSGSTPYSVSIIFSPLYPGTASGADCGLYFADSGSGKIVNMGIQSDTGSSTAYKFVVQHWTNATTYSANATTVDKFIMPTVLAFKIQDTGTNHVFYWSTNGGQQWVQLFSESRTTWLTNTNLVGFYCTASSSYPSVMTLYSWVVGT